MSARALLLLALALPGCVVFHDRAGAPIAVERLPELREGVTTRERALELFGPPTGRFSTNLAATITRVGRPFEPRTDLDVARDDVLTWQQIDVEATVVFFPILFAWGDAALTSRTLVAWFDERGVLEHAAYREDAP